MDMLVKLDQQVGENFDKIRDKLRLDLLVTWDVPGPGSGRINGDRINGLVHTNISHLYVGEITH